MKTETAKRRARRSDGQARRIAVEAVWAESDGPLLCHVRRFKLQARIFFCCFHPAGRQAALDLEGGAGRC
jgi:hypothetical protein